MMESIQDEPPDLVEVDAQENDSASNDRLDTPEPQLDDLSLSKVPLTIVTGSIPL